MKNKIVVVLIVCFALLLAAWFTLRLLETIENNENKNIVETYDIVIYGGGPQAVASAVKASSVTQNQKSILMIVPETKLGSIFTAGGQNLFDLRQYQSSRLPSGLPANYPWAQGGSMYDIYKETSIVFSVEAMTDRLSEMVKEHPNIKVLYQHDIDKVNSKKQKIQSVRVKKLVKGEDGRYLYDESSSTIYKSDIFIDASETGKLSYVSGLFQGTVGREDLSVDKKQMVATLMFKLKGIDMQYVQKHQKDGSPFIFYFSDKGSLGTLGGYEIKDNPLFDLYSEEKAEFRMKPYNGGEDGYSGKNKQTEQTEMWMNMLLVYDVDARKMWRDKISENGLYPKDGGLDPEEAREKAIVEIKSEEFISLIQTLPGMENAHLVLNDNKEPVVGEIMYLRESIHSSNEDGTFALTEEDTIGLKDNKHYPNRIGLGFYNFDSNTYVKGEELSEPRTVNPWYIPYEVLTSVPENLLIPGYAANMDSYTWRAMRVYPNLLVLGDAAGVAAGLSSLGTFTIKNPNSEEVQLLQETLIQHNAILEK